MGTRIISQFNERVSDQWPLVDMAGGRFLAVLMQQNSYGAYITGVSFGMNVGPDVDINQAGIWCIGLSNFIPDPTQSINGQLGFSSNFLPTESGIPRGFYFRFAHSQPLDRDDDFSTPILIPGGESFCLIVATLTRSLSANASASVYLIVRGRLLDEQQSRLLR